VFNHRTYRHGVYCFLHTTAGNDRHYDGTGSDQGVTEPIADAEEGRKEKADDDRGCN
jgi:hypothetical protein